MNTSTDSPPLNFKVKEIFPSTSFSSLFLMAGKVTCFPSFPPKGEVFTEKIAETTGGSRGIVFFLKKKFKN